MKLSWIALSLMACLTFINTFAQEGDNKIALSLVLDEETGLGEEVYTELNESLKRMLETELSTYNSYSPFCLAAMLTQSNQEAGLEANSEISVNLNLKLLVGDFLANRSAGVINIELNGKGVTDLKAQMNALLTLEDNKQEIRELVERSMVSMAEAYHESCEEALSFANQYREMGETLIAMYYLNSVPEFAAECQMRAQEELQVYFMEYEMQQCEELGFLVNAALEEKNKEGIKGYYLKMSYFPGCSEKRNEYKERVQKRGVDADALEASGKKQSVSIQEKSPAEIQQVFQFLIENLQESTELNPMLLDAQREHARNWLTMEEQ